VKNQQISTAATPALVILAAGDAAHPGFTMDSVQGLFAFGAVTGHVITMKDISRMLSGRSHGRVVLQKK
jgi:hypothetical protein